MKKNYKYIIQDYALNLNALRDFIELDKKFEFRAKKLVKDNIFEFLPSLLLFLEDEMTNLKLDKKAKEDLKKLRKDIKEDTKNLFEIKKKDGKNTIVIKDSHYGSLRDKKTKTLEQNIANIKLVAHSSLTSLQSIFEKLIVDLVHKISEDSPQIFNFDSKAIPFSEMNEINSQEDAKDYLLQLEIDGKLREPKEELFEYIGTLTKIDVKFWRKYEEEIVELFQRRNIIVHNDGVVNNQYLEKVSPALIKKYSAKKNKRLITTKEYILKHIQIIEACGIYLVSKIWKDNEPKNASRGEFLNKDIVYPHIVSKNNLVAQHISEFIVNDKCADPTIRDLAQLNHWLAIKQDGKFQSIANEVKKKNFSNRPKWLKLGLFALQKNKKQFFTLLPKVIKDGDINVDLYMEFPIFSEMRKTKESKKFLDRHNKKNKTPSK